MPSPSIAQGASPKTTYLKEYQPSAFLIDTIDLTFDLKEENTCVTSTMSIKRNPASGQQTKNLILNGEALELVSIKINGELLSKSAYQLTDDACTIMNVPDAFQCEIVTNIKPHLNKALSGLYLSNQHYCTQCEAEGFRRITYYLDRPDVLSKYTTTIIADKQTYPVLLSNGNLIERNDLPEGRHVVKWSDPFKKPSYLFALVAGEFDIIEDKFVTMSKREVALKIYVEKGQGQQAHHAMYALKEAMRWDEKAFGREYDLDIYMIVAISDFNMGAMENKGLNIFNTKYVLAKPEKATDDDYMNILSVVGHEYFHNWSGNRVTCRDWFQLSLKEGLTIFRDQSFSEDILSKAFIRIREVNALRETQFPEDAGPLAHPVRPDSYIEINNFYTATIYNKGAEVLRMLQTILGDKQFSKGMDSYFEKFDGQAVTIEDFIQNMEEVADVNLQQFRRWYSQAGTPIVNIEDDFDEHQQIYRLSMNQHTPATPQQNVKQPLHIPVTLGLIDKDGLSLSLDDQGKKELVCHLTEESQTFTFSHITTRPTPSLFRHFSAPVKWDYRYSDDELARLAKHDTDAFNRHEAMQRYLLRILQDLIDNYQHEKPLTISPLLAGLFADILSDQSLDPILRSEMITLPSEKYIAEQMVTIDVDAIHVARETLLLWLANQLKDQFLKIYETEENKTETSSFSIQTIGVRHLKNRCLLYLMLLPAFQIFGMAQFEKSLGKNMSDTQTALIGLVNLDTLDKKSSLQKFYDMWRDDALVVDKWLSIQAMSKSSDTLQQVKKLLHHEAFDIKNPNKVYALIGTFGMRNPTAFHVSTGEGYAFLREVVSELDKFNPQIASRMVKPLTEWRRYDKERQVMMSHQLEILLQEKLSNDLYELVSKSLHSGENNE